VPQERLQKKRHHNWSLSQMKRTRSKSKQDRATPTAAEVAAASSASAQQTISERLEASMKSLAETAQRTSNPMELFTAISDVARRLGNK
jgi:hypothetical protein